MRFFFAFALVSISEFVFAGPPQIDVLGLVPGVSDLQQVQQVGIDKGGLSADRVRVEIGGHQMRCSMSFMSGKLASLFCLTGKGSGKYEQYTIASNLRVHADLIDGFTTKFGKPDSVMLVPVRTRAGVEHQVSTVTWKDKMGNKLELHSMLNSIDMGAISLESAEYIADEAQKEAATDAKKKF